VRLKGEKKARADLAEAPVYRCRSLLADRNREMLEFIGELADNSRGMSASQTSWFDSDLCILAPITSMQVAAFEQLKVTGMLCSRHSAYVHKNRRFFTLAKESEDFTNGREESGEGSGEEQLLQLPASLAIPDQDGGNQEEAQSAGSSSGTAEPVAVAEGSCAVSAGEQTGGGTGGWAGDEAKGDGAVGAGEQVGGGSSREVSGEAEGDCIASAGREADGRAGEQAGSRGEGAVHARAGE
jgi:hypothetical protein